MLEFLHNYKLDFEDRLINSHGNISGIFHGDRIALQSAFSNYHWICCGAYYCRGCTCPGLYMDDHEWWECHGNVYEIYRAAGPGPIRVGDFIGIHYPHRNRWFGCPYTNCRKYIYLPWNSKLAIRVFVARKVV